MTEPRTCTECHRTLLRRAHETLLDFSMRIYCSLDCVEAWRRRAVKQKLGQ